MKTSDKKQNPHHKKFTPEQKEKQMKKIMNDDLDETRAEDLNDIDEPNVSDLTEDDMEALGPIDLSMDGGYDEALRQRTHPVDFAGEDLDVPGAELDDDNEVLGSEDEENNTWSIGGDNHENLDETDPGR